MGMIRTRILCGGLVLLGCTAGEVAAQSLRLLLPTRNDALLQDDGAGFYQYVDRIVKGARSQPWEGGRYGFVRNPRETSSGLVYTRFHEGVDIKPIYRDRDDEPLDTVRVIDYGEVVHANTVERHSNYGKYIVVEHWWDGAPFYSLYAHLNTVSVAVGQQVEPGDPLGQLGYTGRGINRRRAHVHFEINLLLNEDVQPWYDAHFKDDDPNYHGIYNGLNLSGLDVAALYLSLREDTTLTIQDFLLRLPVFLEVHVPNRGMPDLLWRYPWLSASFDPWAARFEEGDPHPSWTLTLSRSGLPLRIEPSAQAVTEPTVDVLAPSSIDYQYLTNGLVTGTGPRGTLTKNGLRYIDLLTRVAPPQDEY